MPRLDGRDHLVVASRAAVLARRLQFQARQLHEDAQEAGARLRVLADSVESRVDALILEKPLAFALQRQVLRGVACHADVCRHVSRRRRRGFVNFSGSNLDFETLLTTRLHALIEET